MLPLIWGLVAVLCTAIVFPAIVAPGEPADLAVLAKAFVPLAGIVYICLTPSTAPIVPATPVRVIGWDAFPRSADVLTYYLLSAPGAAVTRSHNFLLSAAASLPSLTLTTNPPSRTSIFIPSRLAASLAAMCTGISFLLRRSKKKSPPSASTSSVTDINLTTRISDLPDLVQEPQALGQDDEPFPYPVFLEERFSHVPEWPSIERAHNGRDDIPLLGPISSNGSFEDIPEWYFDDDQARTSSFYLTPVTNVPSLYQDYQEPHPDIPFFAQPDIPNPEFAYLPTNAMTFEELKAYIAALLVQGSSPEVPTSQAFIDVIRWTLSVQTPSSQNDADSSRFREVDEDGLELSDVDDADDYQLYQPPSFLDVSFPSNGASQTEESLQPNSSISSHVASGSDSYIDLLTEQDEEEAACDLPVLSPSTSDLLSPDASRLSCTFPDGPLDVPDCDNDTQPNKLSDAADLGDVSHPQPTLLSDLHLPSVAPVSLPGLSSFPGFIDLSPFTTPELDNDPATSTHRAEDDLSSQPTSADLAPSSDPPFMNETAIVNTKKAKKRPRQPKPAESSSPSTSRPLDSEAVRVRNAAVPGSSEWAAAQMEDHRRLQRRRSSSVGVSPPLTQSCVQDVPPLASPPSSPSAPLLSSSGSPSSPETPPPLPTIPTPDPAPEREIIDGYRAASISSIEVTMARFKLVAEKSKRLREAEMATQESKASSSADVDPTPGSLLQDPVLIPFADRIDESDSSSRSTTPDTAPIISTVLPPATEREIFDDQQAPSVSSTQARLAGARLKSLLGRRTARTQSQTGPSAQADLVVQPSLYGCSKEGTISPLLGRIDECDVDSSSSTKLAPGLLRVDKEMAEQIEAGVNKKITLELNEAEGSSSGDSVQHFEPRAGPSSSGEGSSSSNGRLFVGGILLSDEPTSVASRRGARRPRPRR